MSLLLVVSLVTAVYGRPSDEIVPRNVVTVPPNCSPEQEWWNGSCKDVWRSENSGRIQVQPNCPPFQVGYNGLCREIWRTVDTQNVVTVPPNCPPGQQWWNGACRDIWIRNPELEKDVKNTENSIRSEVDSKNVITVPSQCPNGWKPDALGTCRPVLPA